MVDKTIDELDDVGEDLTDDYKLEVQKEAAPATKASFITRLKKYIFGPDDNYFIQPPGVAGDGTILIESKGPNGTATLQSPDGVNCGNATVSLRGGTGSAGNGAWVIIQAGNATGAGKTGGSVQIGNGLGFGGAAKGKVYMFDIPNADPADFGALWCDLAAGNVIKQSQG